MCKSSQQYKENKHLHQTMKMYLQHKEWLLQIYNNYLLDMKYNLKLVELTKKTLDHLHKQVEQLHLPNSKSLLDKQCNSIDQFLNTFLQDIEFELHLYSMNLLHKLSKKRKK